MAQTTESGAWTVTADCIERVKGFTVPLYPKNARLQLPHRPILILSLALSFVAAWALMRWILKRQPGGRSELITILHGLEPASKWPKFR